MQPLWPSRPTPNSEILFSFLYECLEIPWTMWNTSMARARYNNHEYPSQHAERRHEDLWAVKLLRRVTPLAGMSLTETWLDLDSNYSNC